MTTTPFLPSQTEPSSRGSEFTRKRQLVEAIVDSPQVMTWMTDETHLCHFVSRGLLDFLGTTESGMVGMNWLQHFHPNDLERVKENHALALKTRQNFRYEYRVKDRQGQWRWLLDMGVARFHPDGSFVGFIGLDADITEQKIREESLQETQAKLEKEILKVSDREQTRIAMDLHDSVSHSIFGVALKAELLERKLGRLHLPEAAAAREMALELRESVDQLREIVYALYPVTLQKNGLKTALEELAGKLRSRFEVNMEITWPDEDPRFNMDDSLHLYRIVQEAAGNVVRHGKAKWIKVSLQTGEKKDYLLSIADNGTGTIRDSGERAGLGISIMEYRAQLLGGELELHLCHGGGTELLCRFPMPSL